ncbi:MULTISPECIES: hypothetical protein [Pseudoalteromonas]|nr:MULTISPECIES: hypothetical protein [Pseudoalteromonas]
MKIKTENDERISVTAKATSIELERLIKNESCNHAVIFMHVIWV